MSPPTWLSDALRDEWAREISGKAVRIFESLVQAPNASAFKTSREHALDSSLGQGKYVDRLIDSPVEYLSRLGLLKLERRLQAREFRLIFDLPIRDSPPQGVHWPTWATLDKRRRSHGLSERERIYRLEAEGEVENGLCSYCLKPTPFAGFKIADVYPISKGGEDAERNKTISCGSCNRATWLYPPYDSRYKACGALLKLGLRGAKGKAQRFVRVF